MRWNDEVLEQLYAAIGSNIREARVRAGITQTELAKRLELTRSSIANIEGGRQRTLIHSIMQIAEELKVPVVTLLEHDVNTFRPSVIAGLEGQPASTQNFVAEILSQAEQRRREA